MAEARKDKKVVKRQNFRRETTDKPNRDSFKPQQTDRPSSIDSLSEGLSSDSDAAARRAKKKGSKARKQMPGQKGKKGAESNETTPRGSRKNSKAPEGYKCPKCSKQMVRDDSKRVKSKDKKAVRSPTVT